MAATKKAIEAVFRDIRNMLDEDDPTDAPRVVRLDVTVWGTGFNVVIDQDYAHSHFAGDLAALGQIVQQLIADKAISA